jgi:DNA-directed RNA polymerase subunit RPC12/RpoP
MSTDENNKSMRFTCSFCGNIFEVQREQLIGPIDRVECPKCFAVVEFVHENTTIPGQDALFMRVISEGKIKTNKEPDKKKKRHR